MDKDIQSHVVRFHKRTEGMVVKNLGNICLANPKTCSNGFSVSFWIQWRQSSHVKPETWKYLSFIRSSFFSMYYFTNDAFPAEIWDGETNWKTIYIREPADQDWNFYVFTWLKGVLAIYKNGKKVHHDPVHVENKTNSFDLDDGVIEIGGRKNDVKGVEMSLDDFALHEKKLTQAEIEEIYLESKEYMVFIEKLFNKFRMLTLE